MRYINSIVLMAILFCCVKSVSAQQQFCPVRVGESFCDDFSDGDAMDGIPGTWSAGSSTGGTRDASSGDLIVTHTDSMSTRVEELSGLQDISVRSQVTFSQVSGNRDGVVLWARSPADEPSAYWGGIFTDGLLAIGYTPPSGVPLVFASEPSSLDAVTGDVLLQFDVIGDQISLTAWQDGNSMPTAPQLSEADPQLRLTEGGNWGFTLSPNIDGGSDSASAVIRYYSVVPEPNSAVLPAISCLGMLMRVARRKLSSV